MSEPLLLCKNACCPQMRIHKNTEGEIEKFEIFEDGARVWLDKEQAAILIEHLVSAGIPCPRP